MTPEIERELTESFKRGLQELKRLHLAEADVVAISQNFAFVDLGQMPLSEVFVEKEVRLFGRAPLTFPNAPPYGVVVYPFLNRVDKQQVERLHANHDQLAPIHNALGITGAGFFSWDWSGMPLRRPEDLAALYEWARSRVRQEK